MKTVAGCALNNCSGSVSAYAMVSGPQSYAKLWFSGIYTKLHTVEVWSLHYCLDTKVWSNVATLIGQQVIIIQVNEVNAQWQQMAAITNPPRRSQMKTGKGGLNTQYPNENKPMLQSVFPTWMNNIGKQAGRELLQEK